MVPALQAEAPVVPLAHDHIARLAAAGRRERIPARTLVPLDAPLVAIVAAGALRVFRNAAFVRDVTLFYARPGDVLGPGALFEERSAESGAQAVVESELVMLTREAFEAIAADDAGLYLEVARNLGLRADRIQQKVEALSRAPVEARVAAALLELADLFGAPVPAGTRLELPLSQEDLADLAGTTRESASGAVAAFARRGIVRGSRLKGLVVLDRAALEQVRAP
jgi:CRP/FNR family transcriptional regulator